ISQSAQPFSLRLLLADGIIDIGFVQKNTLFAVEIKEAIGQNAVANLAHELVIEMDVVLPEQLPAERLARFRQVMQISARVAHAGRTRAGRIEFLLGEFVNTAAHLQKPARSKDGASVSELRRHAA